ncbi:MAG: prepilin-type N-terminal cleavage/methylation domain-containing protein [Candidatus Zixiibacteriota bacterium]|nr:MAG: prepilin-type N-terminal cleavage/methylation domain-containing protein [candidate division Zixibacteria bacterium]
MIFEQSQRGFTLVEVLIGLLAASVVAYAAMSLYITQHKEMVVQDQIADLQSNVRAAAEVMAKAARMAGHNLIGDLSAIETCDSNPDTIVITYDSGSLINVRLEQVMPQLTSDLNCQDHDLSNLQENSTVYIYDAVTGDGEFFLASRTLTAPSRIRHDTMPLTRFYPVGSVIRSINRIRFYVDQSDPEHPNLMFQSFGTNPVVFAENIIDLNFRYYMENGSIVTQTATPQDIRMVEIDVVGRTDSPDDEFFTDYRTRNFTLRVKVRNLDL